MQTGYSNQKKILNKVPSATLEALKNENGVLMTEQHMRGYLDQLITKGRVKGTLDLYQRGLNKLYDDLADEKRITHGTLLNWREKLITEKYSSNTINSLISAANGYLEFVGAREYQLIDRMKLEIDPQPEISRNEYLRLLSAARLLKRDRMYFLIKIFANTGIPLQEATKVTVEAATAGKMNIRFGGSSQVIYIPKCICAELLAYAKREGVRSGPILLTRDGVPMSRTNISQSMRYLAPYAQVPVEKCNPRCLKKMYQTTVETMERNIALMVAQAQERMLEEEQLTIGWEE